MNPVLYFLVVLTSSVLTATTARNPKPVLDIDGDIITNGSYYVIPSFEGGLALSSRGYTPCPLHIGQAPSPDDMGIPIKFSNWNSKVEFVPQLQDLNIKLDMPYTTCGTSTYWWVDELFSVIAGPKPEGFGLDKEKSVFQIRKFTSYHYKIASCNKKASSFLEECQDVVTYEDNNGVRRLNIVVGGGQPFLVRFKKANVTEGSSKPMPM